VLKSKPFDQLVAARLGEFFAEKSAWFRGLWDVGTVLTLRELVEVAEITPAVISQDALDWFTEDVAEVVNKDEGVPRRALLEIRNLLKNRLPPGALALLRSIVDDIDHDYLGRWAEAIGDRPDKISVERTARAIATHVLGKGFSPKFLHRWLQYHLVHDPKTWFLGDLAREMDGLVETPAKEFTVLIPVNGALDPREAPDYWLDATNVRTWLLKQHFGKTLQGGGWLLKIPARDKWAAVGDACEQFDRIVARLRIGAKKVMRDLGSAYVEGEHEAFPLRAQRRIEVGSIKRQSKLFLNDGRQPTRVDSAFELLAQMDGPAVVAVGAGWAAIEALLAAPGDRNKIISAERMAALVACSFPRAELTLLASRQMRAVNGPIHGRLEACTSNKDRALVLLETLQDKTALTWEDPEQQAAVDRLRVILEKPEAGLRDVMAHASRVLRRLYRQRNLVLHGGMTQSAVLGATLRTAAPLLGAGLDRIAHAWFVQKIAPLELAATARMRIDIAQDRAAPTLVELLE